MNELPLLDPRQMLESAVIALRAGDFAAVEEACRAVLAGNPEQADALHLLGLSLHKQSHGEDAIPLLRRATAASPGAPEIHANLGRVLRAVGRLADAESSLRVALGLGPNDTSIHAQLGAVLHEQGKTGEAIEITAMACRLAPDAPRIQKQLAGLLLDAERYEDAVAQFRKSLSLEPNDPDSLNNLGYALEKLDRLGEAASRFNEGLAIDPKHVQLLANLGVCLRRQNQLGEAEACFRKALEIAPDSWEMARHLSEVLVAMRIFDEAIEILRALRRGRMDDPDLASRLASALYFNGDVVESRRIAQSGLASDADNSALMEILAVDAAAQGDFATAEEYYVKITTADPANSRAIACLAQARDMLGMPDEAARLARTAVAQADLSEDALPACLNILLNICDFATISKMGNIIRRAESMRPDLFWGGFLMVLVLAQDNEARQGLFRLHRRWGKHAEHLAARDPLPPLERGGKQGKLRIGILSSDLHSHAVTKFLMPIIRHYDEEKVELHCYCTRLAGDDPIQNEIIAKVDGFVGCEAMTPRAIAASIRSDEIDALVELNGHTQNSSLAAFAYRAAPIQVEWLGYPYTSGLKDADYVLVDPYVKPELEELMTEKLLIMPESAYCFDADTDIRIDFPMPFERNGYVTFGTMGSPYKINEAVVAAWSEVMRAVPDSRFLLVRRGIDSETFTNNLGSEFGRHGIGPDRLSFVDNEYSDRSHYSFYNDIDISLDTFPLTGGTTTCDALWMGVPVVSLVGENLYERISYTMLIQLGLKELCARTLDDYVKIAVALAQDGDRLLGYRHSLRTRMRDSALCQAERFARNFVDVLIEAVHRGYASTNVI